MWEIVQWVAALRRTTVINVLKGETTPCVKAQKSGWTEYKEWEIREKGEGNTWLGEDFGFYLTYNEDLLESFKVNGGMIRFNL